MNELIKKKKPVKFVALKKLFTLKDGVVKKGDTCTCTEAEEAALKQVRAI
jgi:hypothetical protein